MWWCGFVLDLFLGCIGNSQHHIHISTLHRACLRHQGGTTTTIVVIVCVHVSLLLCSSLAASPIVVFIVHRWNVRWGWCNPSVGTTQRRVCSHIVIPSFFETLGVPIGIARRQVRGLSSTAAVQRAEQTAPYIGSYRHIPGNDEDYPQKNNTTCTIHQHACSVELKPSTLIKPQPHDAWAHVTIRVLWLAASEQVPTWTTAAIGWLGWHTHNARQPFACWFFALRWHRGL